MSAVLICLGAGGVGKTTISAALAVRQACLGARVLCLTIDPAKRLAESLGLSVTVAQIHRVPTDSWREQGIECSGSLDVLMLDAKQTFDDLVARYAGSAEARERIYANRLYQHIASYLAGTQEYMAMEKLYEVRQSGLWDVIVLDTPPTAHALDFLDAPERLVATLDSPAVRWLMQRMAGRKPWQLVGQGADAVLRALGRITGAGFLEQTGEFLVTMSQLFGGFAERAAQVAGILRGPEVTFYVVSTAQRLAVRESQFLLANLQQLGGSKMVMVFNQVMQRLPSLPSEDETLGMLAANESATLRAAMHQAYEDEASEAALQAQSIEAMQQALAGALPSVCVPRWGGDIHGLANLSKIGSFLSSEAAA